MPTSPNTAAAVPGAAPSRAAPTAGDEAPRAKRRRLPPDERRAMLRDAAFAEFAAAGYAAASMGAVSRRAGVAKGLLYHHFPGGKADLFAAVVRGVLQPTFEGARQAVTAAQGSSLDLLRDLLERVFGSAADPRALVVNRLLISEGERFPELSDLFHEAVVEPGAAILSAVIRDGVARGEFRPETAGWPVQLLLAPAILVSTWRLSFAGRHPLDADALRRAQLDLLVSGLLADGWRAR